jgi:hypothetical protein
MEGADRPRGRGETPFPCSSSYEEAAAIQNEGGTDNATTKETAVVVRPTRRGVRGGQMTRRGRGAHPPTTQCPPNMQQTPRVPEEFWLNIPPCYIPFKIMYNGREVEAKYVTIHMTNDPYAPGAPVYR